MPPLAGVPSGKSRDCGNRTAEPVVGPSTHLQPGGSVMVLNLRRMLRLAAGAVAVPAVVAAAAAPAGACGGLVGENGSIQLTKTTTLAAYHDGVERYVTSFDFSGQGKEVGSIVPLPAVPSKVERGGSWTLQRLEREVAPPVREALAF